VRTLIKKFWYKSTC